MILSCTRLIAIVTIVFMLAQPTEADAVIIQPQALLDVIKTRPETARPSYWAPFSLFGEP